MGKEWSFENANDLIAIGECIGAWDCVMMKVLELQEDGLQVSFEKLITASNLPEDADDVGEVQEKECFLTWDELNRKGFRKVDPETYWPARLVVSSFSIPAPEQD
ncbi:MAG TPA: hypothetical protein PLL78_03900 [Fimbriimonadaceae bacterium]|nr:hypothetical protein [Fimbriimonadaceae bacterium]HRJ95804.1 hypothetical protein [Fimbriimonadaceae bacterium]